MKHLRLVTLENAPYFSVREKHVSRDEVCQVVLLYSVEALGDNFRIWGWTNFNIF